MSIYSTMTQLMYYRCMYDIYESKLIFYTHVHVQKYIYSGRRDVLRVHYRPASSPGQLRVETFPLRLADDSWHRLAVTVSGDQIEVSHVSL